jgi:hypothetical protein
MTTTASYEAHQLEQILSLLNDQRECLTLRSIMLELTVTRSVARDVLEEVVKRSTTSSDNGTASNYEVVRMIPKKGADGKRTVMELVVTDPTASDDENNSKGSIFSIAIRNDAQDNMDMDEDDVDDDGNVISKDPTAAAGAIQIVSAAHEKALAVQRDMFTAGSNGGAAQLCSIFGADGVNTDGGSRCILPAQELCVVNEEGIRVIRREKRGRDVLVVGASYPSSSAAAGKKSNFGSNSSSAASKPSTTASTKKGKTTTAAAFFKNASTTSSKPKKAEPKKAEPKKAEPKKTKKEEEKENSRNKKATASVDDFVGDVDEDEEFLEEENARKARVAKEARREARELINDEKAKKRNTDGMESRRSKVAPKRRKSDEEIGDNDMDIEYDDGAIEEGEKKTGAMDAFTQKKEKSAPTAGSTSTSSGGVKKRRKKLVEETTVDANGYMRTETITVWEDISDEEVDVKAKPAVAKPAAAPKSKGKSTVKKSGGPKKQAGLASFFAKKK